MTLLASVSFADKLHGWAVSGSNLLAEVARENSFSPFAPSNVILSTSDAVIAGNRANITVRKVSQAKATLTDPLVVCAAFFKEDDSWLLWC